MAETMTGDGSYRVTFWEGSAVLVEIWREGKRMSFGTRDIPGPCARCGTQILLYEPTNSTMEVCDTCALAITEET
jgi:hypothetical protein